MVYGEDVIEVLPKTGDRYGRQPSSLPSFRSWHQGHVFKSRTGNLLASGEQSVEGKPNSGDDDRRHRHDGAMAFSAGVAPPLVAV